MDNLSIGFPNIYVNFSKANGYCYVYAYTPQYDKETKRTKKTSLQSEARAFLYFEKSFPFEPLVLSAFLRLCVW